MYPNLLRALFLSVGLLASTAWAGDQHYKLNLPAGSLSAAVETLARQANLQVLFDQKLLEGKTTAGLSGDYTAREALEKLLSGSGIGFNFTTADAVSLKRGTASSEGDTLPEVKITASPYGATQGYAAPVARSATKTDTPIMETPVSIQTVTSDVITDRRYTRLQETLENVGGVVPIASVGEGSRYMIRGFRQDRIYRDGLQANGLNAAFPTEYDTATTENIEVVKGPASVLYGRIEPGGLINITTKKPQAVSKHSIGAEAGSFGFRRIEADSTGRLGEDSKLLYRMVAAVQESSTFKDFGQDNRIVFAPSLTWQPAASTDFRVSVEYFQGDRQAEYGTPVIGTRPVNLPRQRSFLDPNDPKDQFKRLQIGIDLNHKLNDAWTLRHRFLFGQLNNREVWVDPIGLRADNRTLDRNIFGQTADSKNYSTNLDLVGDLDLGTMKHHILVGMDYLEGRTHYGLGGNWRDPNPALAIDIYNPTYGINPALFSSVFASYVMPAFAHSVFKDNVFGLYLQDQIKVTEKWQVLVGGRYDWATTGRGPGATEAAAEAAVPQRKDKAFSPRLAALYQFRPDLSTYASWSQSFGANNLFGSIPGQVFDPQQGEQYELGLKAELFEQRLFANMSIYHLTKSNVISPDTTTADPTDTIATAQRARGAELDLSGKVTDRINVTASYAYTDAVVTKDIVGLIGKRINSMPQHMLSLWGRYDLPSGLNIGLGGVVIGSRQGDLTNTFILPGYARLDAMASYAFKMGSQALTARLNVRNLLDKLYYESSAQVNASPREGVVVGAPRSINASLNMEF